MLSGNFYKIQECLNKKVVQDCTVHWLYKVIQMSSGLASLPEPLAWIALSFIQGLDIVYRLILRLYDIVPGSRYIYKYIKASHQRDPYRTLLEFLLFLFMLWYFNRRKYKPGNRDIVLTKQVKNYLLTYRKLTNYAKNGNLSHWFRNLMNWRKCKLKKMS